MRILKLTSESKKNILENLLKRSPNSYGEYESAVNDILSNVKTEGDKALFQYTKDFDKADINSSNVVVTQEEIDEAYNLVDKNLLNVIRKALVNIRSFHEKQKQYSWFDSKPDGTMLGQKVTALSRVGVYVPGGKAAYPSSVLMNVIPAKVAGVEEIILCTPPGKDGKVYKVQDKNQYFYKDSFQNIPLCYIDIPKDHHSFLELCLLTKLIFSLFFIFC